MDLAETINDNEELFLCSDIHMQKKKLKIHLLTSVVPTDFIQRFEYLTFNDEQNIPVLKIYKPVGPRPHYLKKR